MLYRVEVIGTLCMVLDLSLVCLAFRVSWKQTAAEFLINMKLLSLVVVACGDPGALTNGFRIGDKFTYGESVIYDCDAGFKLQGSIIRKCEMNGQWSGTAASCNGQ